MNTRTATYLPRFRVGASSEVAAREVSSPIPAPAPLKAMPAGRPVSLPRSTHSRADPTNEVVHAVYRSAENVAKDEQTRADQCDVTAAQEIGQRTHEGAHRGESK